MIALSGFLIESVVAVLLAVAIGYCALLDRRLQRIRLNEEEMRRTIIDLTGAAERAEKAIETLRDAVHDCDRELMARLKAAEKQSAELAAHIRAGGDILARISRIVAAGKAA